MMIRAMSSLIATGMILTAFGHSSAVFAADDDEKTLAGAWQVVSLTDDGQENAVPPDLIFRFTKGKVVQSTKGPPRAPNSGRVQRRSMPITLNPEKSPKQIDMTHPAEPGTKS